MPDDATCVPIHVRERLEGMGVSRETLDRISEFVGLTLKWTRTINLISKGSAGDVWNRHVLDSLQLLPDLANARSWIDLGSGGGFPALPCAIVLQQQEVYPELTLVEADLRKVAFLRSASQVLGLEASLRNERIENLVPEAVDVVTARALAPLEKLVQYALPHLGNTGVLIAPKGQSWKEEIDLARRRWRFTVEARPSITDPRAMILTCRDIQHV